MNLTSEIYIKEDNIENAQVIQLLNHHLQKMKEGSPEESVHALKIDELKKAEITFWTLWIGNNLAGCGALKKLTPFHGEVKSMRTHDNFLRKGVAQKLLHYIIAEARQRGYKQLSLETGSSNSFAPAHALYNKLGFIQCEPFEGYKEDPNSIFMTKVL